MGGSADSPDHNSSDESKQTATTPKARDSFDNHNSLIRWVEANGGFIHPNLQLNYSSSKGYHGTVKEGSSIAAHTRITSCPVPVMLSVLNVLDIPPFRQHGTRFPEPFIHRYQFATDILQAFYLMEQYILGAQSFWSPYLRSLPSLADVDELQYEAEEDLVWIRGTNLEAAIVARTRKWFSQFEEANTFLRDLGWDSSRSGKYTYELFRWASTIFGSRSFTSTVLHDTPPADKARPSFGRGDPKHQLLTKLFSERFAVLLPLLDILNHKPLALVEWQARVDFVGLQVDEDYASGQEVFNNYGPRDNEGLLLSYGFVLEDNPFEHVLISINAHPGTPLEIARTWPPDDRSNELFNCYIYDPAHPIVKECKYVERALFSYDLLDSISVMISNDREFQAMHAKRQTLMSTSLPDGFQDFRNLLATLAQIMYDSGSRARRIHSTDPSQARNPIHPMSDKQRNAQIYRQKQVKILQAAEGACAFSILNACMQQKTTDLSLSMRSKMPDKVTPVLEELCSKHRCLTRQHELFTSSALINLFPSPQANSIRSCFRQVEDAILEAVPSHMRSHEDRVKTQIAIGLSALCHTYRSRTQLSFRLQSWYEELASSYPPEDPNWNYVPPPGPWAPGEEPPPALMNLLGSVSKVTNSLGRDSSTKAWLEPKLVCWAWNVMEEEGIRVPVEIERFASEDAAQVDGITGFMIYCRQYD